MYYQFISLDNYFCIISFSFIFLSLDYPFISQSKLVLESKWIGLIWEEIVEATIDYFELFVSSFNLILKTTKFYPSLRKDIILLDLIEKFTDIFLSSYISSYIVDIFKSF